MRKIDINELIYFIGANEKLYPGYGKPLKASLQELVNSIPSQFNVTSEDLLETFKQVSDIKEAEVIDGVSIYFFPGYYFGDEDE